MKLFVDCETGGLDPKHHPILTLCIGNKILGYHNFRFNPNEDLILDPKAMEINGITGFPDDSADLVGWLKDHVKEYDLIEPIGHNYMFDIGFIQQITGTKGYYKYFSRRYLDTMIIARFLSEAGAADFEGFSLSALCTYFDIENLGAHSAQGDVQATEKLYAELISMMGAQI